MRTIELDQVKKVYVGADNCCRCGCRGNYIYTGFLPKDDKRVKTLLTRAKNMVESGKGEITDESEEYINISYGNNRAITIYFL